MVPEFTRPWLLLLALPALFLILFLCPPRVRRSLRGRISMGMHTLISLLLVLALSGFSLNTSGGKTVSYLILDRSASAPEAEVLSLARKALSAGQDGETGIIVFGQNALVEKAPSSSPELTEIHSRVNADGSDLAQALGLGQALLGNDTLGGLAVISDGLTDVPAYSSLPVNVLLTEKAAGTDAQISAFHVPSMAYAGQNLNLDVAVDSNTRASGSIYVYQDGEIIARNEVQLFRGSNHFSFAAAPSRSALTSWKVRIAMDGDTVPENNERSAFTRQLGSVRVLLAEGSGGDAQELKSMLEHAGMECDVLTASMLPDTPEDFMAWQAVCMVNVDLDSVRSESVDAVSRAVTDFGVGLVTFGGDSTYALGNFRASRLESLLPVTMDVKNRQELPSTALLLVIDHSGSMADSSWGVSRLDVAKQAAAESVSVLTDRDSIGVIAFDDSGHWVWPLSPLTDPDAVRSAIGTIRADGGTAFYTPLAMALNALSTSSAAYRHVIFLTDGEAGDSGYDEIVASMAEQHITLTTVAVGDGADTSTLLRLARIGGGRAYRAGQFDNLPRIFAKETMKVAQNYLQNRTFTPAVTDEILTGFDGFPVLDGYLASTEKDTATVALVSDRGDPILAWWQPGRGRVVSFMSDVQGIWTSSFLAWKDAPAFFAGLVTHVLPADDGSGTLELRGHTLVYTAPVIEDGAVCEYVLSASDGTKTSGTMTRTGASTYETELDGTGTSCAVSLNLVHGTSVLAHLESGVSIPYSSEYDLRRSNQEDLTQLALASGGRVVSGPEELLSFPPRNVHSRKPLTAFLLWLGLGLFLLDIAQRRLLKASAKKKPEKKKSARPGQVRRTKPEPKENATDALFEQMQKRRRL